MENNNKTILIVEDEKLNINVLAELLKDEYKIIVAKTGKDALSRLELSKVDLILLDIMLPDTDGYSVCRKIKSSDRLKDIPIIFITSKNNVDDEIKGLSMGAIDYITKPFSPPILKTRIETHLKLVEYSRRLKNQNKFLEMMVEKKTKDITTTRDMAVYSMAMMAEQRDKDTGYHLKRTQSYILMLCNQLRENNKYTNILTDDFIDRVYKSAPLHDIGKVSIPDKILNKPAKLTEEEYEMMKDHSYAGYETINSAAQIIEQNNEFLNIAKEIILYHHEKWDGSGYPEGLQGENIPLSARLMAVADVFDALINKRVYKDAFPEEEVTKIMIEGSGTHFDPKLIDAFFAIKDHFFEIAEKLKLIR